MNKKKVEQNSVWEWKMSEFTDTALVPIILALSYSCKKCMGQVSCNYKQHKGYLPVRGIHWPSSHPWGYGSAKVNVHMKRVFYLPKACREIL